MFEQIFNFSVRLDVPDIPVGVLSTSVDLSERFFMKKSNQPVSLECLLDDFSCQKVLVNGVTCISENACDFELIIGDLVVPGLEGDTQLKQLCLNFFQSLLDCVRNLSVVMLASLLVSCGVGSDQNSAQPFQVLSLLVCVLRNGEEFLLESQEHLGSLVLDSQFVKKCVGSLDHSGLTHSEESFVAQSFSVVGDEKGRDVEGVVSSPDVEEGVVVPEGVGSGGVGLTKST